MFLMRVCPMKKCQFQTRFNSKIMKENPKNSTETQTNNLNEATKRANGFLDYASVCIRQIFLYVSNFN